LSIACCRASIAGSLVVKPFSVSNSEVEEM